MMLFWALLSINIYIVIGSLIYWYAKGLRLDNEIISDYVVGIMFWPLWVIIAFFVFVIEGARAVHNAARSKEP